MKLIEINNKAGTVKLNEAVSGESILRMIDEIGRLFGAQAMTEGSDFGAIMNIPENGIDILNIEINSPGGSVFDGYTLYHEIKSLRDRGVIVNATITGMAASMASVIAMACDEVHIVPHGRMMIHNAAGSVYGDAQSLRETADMLDGISADLAQIYTDTTGIPIEEVKALMDKETWMNAETSVKLGFATKIILHNSKTVDISTKANNNKMITFLTNKAAMEKITGLEARGEELEADIAEMTTTIKSLQEDLAEKIKALEEEKETSTETEKALKEANDAVKLQEDVIAEANKKLESFDADVEQKVQLYVASLGYAGKMPTHSPPEERNEKEEGVLEKYEALQGKEKWAYLAKHSQELAQAARNKTNK